MPHRDVREGDVIFIRARALQNCGDALQVQIVDYPNFVMTTWVPAAECAKEEDLDRLRPRRNDKGQAA